jgi:hypothetical protein
MRGVPFRFVSPFEEDVAELHAWNVYRHGLADQCAEHISGWSVEVLDERL